MKRFNWLLAVCLCCMLSLVQAEPKPLYPFANPVKQAQFSRLIDQLRCLVCQNENLADSEAKLAQDLRQQVYNMVQAGKSDQAIKQYLVNRYGDFVLFKPPLNQQTLILWFAPFALLVIGGLLVINILRKRSKSARG